MKTLQQASDIWQETNLSNDTRVWLTDFDGDVMAWSFGSTSGVISCPDFELVIPDLARNVPALIGQSPSEAEMVDGEVCLFHPVVTCLAGSGEIFNPPLLLRFSVGDAMESGSDVGSSNEDEESYKADLRSRYSVVKREEGSSTWLPFDGEIKKMDNGVFVLEAQISHFTDYALKQGPLSLPWPESIGQGGVDKITDIKKLRNISLFENKGDKNIMVYYWRRRTRRFWIPRARVSLGVAPVEVGGEVDREILDNPTDEVYSKLVPSNQSVALNNTKSLEVAWATLEPRDGHRLVTVWGRDTMGPREAMRIGPLPERVYADVRDLQITDGEHVGTRVRASLENR